MNHRLFALALLLAAPAVADESLDGPRVVALARLQAPAVRLAEARAGEARARRVGARAPMTPNPELGFSLGPRAIGGGNHLDVIGTLLLPMDISGAPGLRGREADERARAAEVEIDEARRAAVGEALDAWVLALGAEERVRLETERAGLDEALLASARARRRAGTTGDLDLRLAEVLRGQGLARLRAAEGEHGAALVVLRGRLGLPADAPAGAAGSLAVEAPPPLAVLLARLPLRPDRVLAERRVAIADTGARLQGRLAVPVPRLTVSGGVDPEPFGYFGLDVPVPVFQRNQTARAEAAARRGTAAVERAVAQAAAEAELRAAYASYEGAARAFAALQATVDATADAEHLATRAYELGQSTLAALVVARRETAGARAAHLEARIALGRARVALDRAAGTLP